MDVPGFDPEAEAQNAKPSEPPIFDDAGFDPSSTATAQNIQSGRVEQPHSISTLTNTKWTKPEYTLPVPSLQFLFHLECDMETFRHIGEGPYGDRSTVIFKGGRFEGPKLRGEILPGGGGMYSNSALRLPRYLFLIIM
jgi:hypothetical protein